MLIAPTDKALEARTGPRGTDAIPLPTKADRPHGVRYSAWREHIRALQRSAYPKPKGYSSLTGRVADLLLPWGIRDYPGASAALSVVLGLSRARILDLMQGLSSLSAEKALTLAGYLRGRAAQEISLASELEAYAVERAAHVAKPRGFRAVRLREGVRSDGRVRGPKISTPKPALIDPDSMPENLPENPSESQS